MKKISVVVPTFNEEDNVQPMAKAISDLFSGKYEALEVIKLRDIYKEIENSLDTCYHISDMILNIAFKQS